MAKKQKIEKASRRERRQDGQQHRGWNYDNKKGKSWNARATDDSGNQVGKYNPSERLFGPQGGSGGGSPDRPADTGANIMQAEQRGDAPQGTTAATQRPGIENWYHRSDLYSNPELTKPTSVKEWQHTKGTQI